MTDKKTDPSYVQRFEKTKNVPKRWGYELWIANSHLYCGKQLNIFPLCQTSLHFHVNKTEHIYVSSGTMTLEVAKKDGSGLQITRLKPGDSVIVTPGLMHRLKNENSTEDLVLMEFSTQHFDEDSYRVQT